MQLDASGLGGYVTSGSYGKSYSMSTSAFGTGIISGSTINTSPYIGGGLYSWGQKTVTESIEDIVYYKVMYKIGNVDKNNICMKNVKLWLKKQI